MPSTEMGKLTLQHILGGKSVLQFRCYDNWDMVYKVSVICIGIKISI